MSEALTSAELTKFITGNAQKQFGLLTGVEREVQNLENNLKAIQAVLRDAEVKQLQSEGIKHWLERLKDASYDIEDELDEWNTRLLKYSQNASLLRRKVLSLISYFPFGQVLRRHGVATRLKEVNEELDQIAKEKDRYQLATREIKQPRSRESVSFVDVSKLHGRGVEKGNMKGLLLSESSQGSELQTISVVGMGGIGKTALAQLVYNDGDVQAHFHERIWVCVSNDFNQTKVARDIIVALEVHDISSMSLPESIPLETLLNGIRRKIKSKRFLLVLDDVWTKHDEKLEPIIATLKHGMPGSRILVTTREESVAQKMKSSCVFHLETLPEVECLLILRELAFHGRDKKECEDLEEIGREIAKKSEGLPLVAKTLGGLLQEKRTKEEWENVLHSPIWKLSLAQEYIFTLLFLSYYNLSFAIKQCLLYCATFPKNSILSPRMLIPAWSSQGYLNSDDDNSAVELIGEGYFHWLATRSFFQDFRKLEDGKIFECKMHDIVHDFLQFLTKNEIVVEEVNKVGKWVLDVSSEKARYLRLNFAVGAYFPMSIYGAKKLRSLEIRMCNLVHTKQALLHLLNGSKCLRLLVINSLFGDFVKDIPNEIGKLIHLRFLDLSYCENMKRLPKTVAELYNLQYMFLFYCNNLEKLPDELGSLTNLRVLNCFGCFSLKCFPKSIGRLTSLREAKGMIVRADRNDTKELSLRDLENLDQLCVLGIELVGNAIDEDEAKRAKFQNKMHLKKMKIVAKDIQKNDAIKALNPPHNSSVFFYRNPKTLIGDIIDFKIEGNTEEDEEEKRILREFIGVGGFTK